MTHQHHNYDSLGPTSTVPTHHGPFVPDPTVENAVQRALAATDSKKSSSMVDRVLILLAVFILVVGGAGIVIGAINAATISRQQDRLKSQFQCVDSWANAAQQRTSAVNAATDARDTALDTALKDVIPKRLGGYGATPEQLHKDEITYTEAIANLNRVKEAYPISKIGEKLNC